MPLRFRPEVLERARLEAGLSRDALAAPSKVSRVTIFMVETGRTVPRPETVKALADALGIAVADLYDEVAEDVA
jgi:DNA-binding XRE family transcriptional regulator